MSDRRIVLLEQVPLDEQNMVDHCFFCASCPYHGKRVKATMAVEAVYPTGRLMYYGLCGNHAEVYPLTDEERAGKPLLCPHCFNRDGTRREQ